MSGIGIPQSGLSGVVALTRPDLVAEQNALARRQAFASALLGQQPQFTGFGGALDQVGSKILGAIMAKRGDKQALDIANQYRSALFDNQGGPVPPPTASSAPPLASLPPAGPPAPAGGAQSPPLASMPPGGLPQGAPPPVSPGGPAAPAAAPAPRQSLFDQAVPDIPGVDPRRKYVLYASDPAAYMKAYYASQAQPDAVKTANFAYGGDTDAARRDLAAQGKKAGTLEFREKGFGVLPSGQIIYGPNEESNTYFTTGPNGEPIAHAIKGGAAVAAGQAGAIEGAREANKPIEVTLPDGSRRPMYAGDALGPSPANAGSPAAVTPPAPNAGALPLGIRSNNPGNLQPSGHEAQYANPTAGILAASSNLDNYSKNGINTLHGIISTWAPQYDKTGKQINDTPAYIADVAHRLGGVDPTKPLNLADPNVKGAVLEAMFAHENGNRGVPSGGVPPKLGVSTAQAEVNKSAGEASANSAHINANSEALLKAIDGMIAINDQVPDSTFLGPETKAKINEIAPNLPGFRGDAGALGQWEQLNSIGVLGGIKNLGLGRVDIPIVKQIQAGGGIPANIPAADRLRLLTTLKAEVQNNRAAAQNTAVNLNNPNATAPAREPLQTYPAGKPAAPQAASQPGPQHVKVRVWNPVTGKLEYR